MATSVSGAFAAFRRDSVDLDPSDVKVARASRDYLLDQIKALPTRDATVPLLTGSYVPSGSFARRTKIRPLDDIDFLIIMDGNGMREVFAPNTSSSSVYRLDPGQSTSPLRYLTGTDGYINSTRVINKFKTALADVPNYQKADLRKDGEAVTLQLVSYSWNFDIVPGEEVEDGAGTRYYLIPTGWGAWKRTDPRKDASALTTANQKHNELLLPLIRLIKYWNRQPGCPTLRSFYLETICLKTFEFQSALTSLPEGVRTFFEFAPGYMQMACPDPSGFGPNLDAGIDWATKSRVTSAMNAAAAIARAALQADRNGQTQTALAYWRQIFGTDFPSYG